MTISYRPMDKLDSMRWFSHWRSPSPPGGHSMVSSVVACCVQPTTHALLCTSNGDDSAVFHFLSLVTLTCNLDIRTQARFLYDAPKFHKFHHTFNRMEEDIVCTNKQTHWQTHKPVVFYGPIAPSVPNAPELWSQHAAAAPVQLDNPGERRAAAAVPLPESP